MNIQLCVIDTDASVLILKHNLWKVQYKCTCVKTLLILHPLKQVIWNNIQYYLNLNETVEKTAMCRQGKVLGNVSRLVQFGIPQLLNHIISYIRSTSQNDFPCNKPYRIYCNTYVLSIHQCQLICVRVTFLSAFLQTITFLCDLLVTYSMFKQLLI